MKKISNYQARFEDECADDIRKARKKRELIVRLNKKIGEILENPHHYKTLRNVLKNRCRVRIGSFVLIFEIDEDNRLVVFNSFKHHNEAYE
ncbi:MAG: type II toxin-antitoxin system RelE/ParE family toxin [Deltaproteobacteria bacterium]|nr:type II toxin-antitoxin system RelE/ParE family toxin [Deltaproteobacteria bacterium]